MNFSIGNSYEDNALLGEINRKKAELLAPAIFYTVVLMVVGTLGNPLAIYIYGWRWQNTTTRHFLLWLACLDLINCLVTIPTEIYVMTNYFYFPNPALCRMSRFITYVINNATSFVFLAIAADRYIRICHPHRSTCSVGCAKIACGVSLLVGVTVSWPAIVLYGSKIVPLPTTDNDKGYILGVICEVRNEFDGTPYPIAFFGYLWFGFSVCVIILSVIYIHIGKVMLKRRREKKRKKNKKKEQREANQQQGRDGLSGTDAGIVFEHTNDGLTTTCDISAITEREERTDCSGCAGVERGSGAGDCALGNCAGELRPFKWSRSRIRPPKSTLMLFAITAVFILTFLPFLILMIIRVYVGSKFYPSLGPTEQVLVNVFLRSYLMNNVANPVVYGACNSQFRNEVRKTFRLSRRRRGSSLSRAESKLSDGASN